MARVYPLVSDTPPSPRAPAPFARAEAAGRSRSPLQAEPLQAATQGALAQAQRPGRARLVVVGPGQHLGPDLLLEVVERGPAVGQVQHDRPRRARSTLRRR